MFTETGKSQIRMFLTRYFYRRFANLYIGWGHKFTAYNYTPPNMPDVQDQYKIGPEVMEVQDPTFEQEEEWRLAHLPVLESQAMGKLS